ncbi:hypothetical protein PT974_11393 [Cladobotryum mycophilum]|uniref:Extracellular membrane protein CFEM domain-containing protein n=1 Tax=Cladobotryum mycophilum TaxID=491253 RepID=A0ABR0S537_9HYPO
MKLSSTISIVAAVPWLGCLAKEFVTSVHPCTDDCISPMPTCLDTDDGDSIDVECVDSLCEGLESCADCLTTNTGKHNKVGSVIVRHFAGECRKLDPDELLSLQRVGDTSLHEDFLAVLNLLFLFLRELIIEAKDLIESDDTTALASAAASSRPFADAFNQRYNGTGLATATAETPYSELLPFPDSELLILPTPPIL